MKKIFDLTLLLLIFLSVTMCGGCSSNDLYGEMPREIQSFISQYYPNTQLYSFTYTDTSYTVILKNGPTIVFDNNCKWTSINGNGSPLPQTLLFDDFPPILYNYLQETETTDQVFSVTRNSTKYVVELLNTTLTYVIATGELSSSEAAS